MTRARPSWLMGSLLLPVLVGVYAHSALPLASHAHASGPDETTASAPRVLSPNASISLPAEPGALLPVGSAIWVTQPLGLARVSVPHLRVLHRARLSMTPYDLVTGDGSLWAVGMVPGRRRVTSRGNYPVIVVARMHPRTGRVLASMPIPARSNGNRLAFAGQRLFVTDPAEAKSSRIFTIDPETHRVATLAGGQEPVALVSSQGRVWSANHDDRTLRAHDARTGRTTAFTLLPGEPHGLAVASGWLWVADGHHNRVLQIDPESLRIIRRVDLGHESGPLAPAARGGVWATGPWDQHVSMRLRRIDTLGRIAETVLAGDPIIDFVSSRGSLWIAVTRTDRLLRITE